MSTHFDDDLALRPAGPGRWTATLNRRWWIQRGPNGGFLAALVLRAIQRTLADDDRVPRSLTIHYLDPVAEGDATLEVDVVRSGRSLSTVAARLVQGGDRPALLALAAFSAGRDGVAFNELTTPDAPPPDDVAPLTAPPGAFPPMFDQVEMRPVFGAAPFTGGTTAEVGGWLRLAGGGRPLDPASLALFTDAWFPAVFARMAAPGAAPTVDLTIHFRNPAPAGDDTVFARFRSRLAADGFVEEDGELWSRDGVLLAQSRQLALALAG